MMRKLFLTLLSLVLAFGGESPALDVAARHLEAYRQQRKACGDEDELATLRLKANYIRLKSWMALETDDDAYVQAQKELLDLRERAYLLAKARYEQGLASLRDVYETGAELYAMTEHTEKVHPTLAEMKAMYLALFKGAKATENRVDELKTAIIWFSHVEIILSDVVSTNEKELFNLLQERYRQGLCSYWELAHAKLNLLLLTNEEQYAAYTAELYNEIEENAVSVAENDYRVTELLFLARCSLVRYRKWSEFSH